MAQVVTRLDDRLMAEVDMLVAEGVVATRSEAVRLGLERLVDEHQRSRGGGEIVAAYRRLPPTGGGVGGGGEATRAPIKEEPWGGFLPRGRFGGERGGESGGRVGGGPPRGA